MAEHVEYDVNFVEEVPEYLKCVVCFAVMRQPVQIMSCGHRFCKPCFERIQGYSKQLKTELCCPLDRDVIDINKVFDDTAISRDICNLQVMCSDFAKGCPWRGDLRNLKDHEEDCQYSSQKTGMNHDEEIGLQMHTQLFQRLIKCEKAISEKENDIALLKYTMEDLKISCNEKEEEIDLLKEKNCCLEIQVKRMEENNIELKKQLERDFENLDLKYQLLQKRTLEKDIDVNERTEKRTEKIVVELNTAKENNIEMRKQFERDLENIVLKDQLYDIGDTDDDDNDDDDNDDDDNDDDGHLTEIKTDNTTTHDNTCMVNTLSSSVPLTNKEFSENINSLRKDMENALLKVELMEAHTKNIENILFYDWSVYGHRNLVLRWNISNFCSNFVVGKTLSSPIFLTQVHGYSFRLFIKRMFIDEKYYLGLFLRLSSRTPDVDLKPFKMSYSLSMVDRNGKTLSKCVFPSDIEAHRKRAFSILPGHDLSEQGWGFPEFLVLDELDDFIVNDMIAVKCILTSY